MVFLLVFTFGFFYSAQTFAVVDCTLKTLESLLADSDDDLLFLASFNEREKLTSKVSKEVKPLLQDTEVAYQIGYKIRFVNKKISELGRIKPQTIEIKNTLHDLEIGRASLNRELIDLNNNFVTKMHALFKKDGIPSVIVKSVDDSSAWRFFPGKNREIDGKEVLTLKLDFSAPSTTHRGFNYYRRIKKVFGISETTVSLKLTGENAFLGVYLPSLGRIEIGPEGAKNLLRQYINSTGKHESRHAMFARKRTVGDESIFHTQFQASSDGHLLNEIQFYEGYMSAEELYTFSTDLQTLAQGLKGEYLTDLKLRSALLNQIGEGADGLMKVSQTQMDVTEKMIKSLKETLSHPAAVPDVILKVYPLDNFTLSVTDDLGRTATTTFVSEAEKKLLSGLKSADHNLTEAIEVSVIKDLNGMGIDVVDLEKRMGEKLTTTEENELVMGLYVKYLAAPEFAALRDAKQIALRPVIIAAKVRMEKLNRLATIQNAEAKTLQALLKQPSSPKQIEVVRKQMFLIGKNVKEKYKGFALNPGQSMAPPRE